MLDRLERSHYRYILGLPADGGPVQSRLAQEMIAAITGVLGPGYSLTATKLNRPTATVTDCACICAWQTARR